MHVGTERGPHLLRLLSPLYFLCFLPSSAHADELRLRDGSKIVGTIVGFENDSFKVETSYGYALVRRDKVASIVLSESRKNQSEPKKPPAAPKEAASAAAPSAPAQPAPVTATTPPAPPSPATQPAAAAPVASPPPRIREEVTGNVYTNHLYGFRLYKPPSWQIIEGAHQSLPNAVVAMGTSDEATLLVVGHEPIRGSLQAQVAATEQRLRELYESYRSLGEERTTISGLPAVLRRFRGTAEGRDWSGRVIWVARGNEIFTIFGITYAESDLIQIQENVIAKAIASLSFLR